VLYFTPLEYMCPIKNCGVKVLPKVWKNATDTRENNRVLWCYINMFYEHYKYFAMDKLQVVILP
jgi:hypothetical protein